MKSNSFGMFIIMGLSCSTSSAGPWEQQVNEALNQFKQTPDGKQIDFNLKFLKYASRSFLSQNNFQIDSSFGQTTRNESSNPASNNKNINQNSLSFGVSYTNWNGLDASVSTSRISDEFQQAYTAIENPNEYNPTQFRLSYELIQEGDSGVTRSRSYAQYQGTLSQIHQTKSQQIQLTAIYQNHFIDYTTTLCKLQALSQAQTEVKETLQKGKAAKRAGTMPYKDYLNYEVLDNSISQNIINQQNQKDLLLEQASTWDKQYVEFIQKITTPYCMVENKTKPQIDPAELGARTPALAEVMALKKQALYEKNVNDKSYLPSIKPFVQYNNGVVDVLGDINNETQVGVELTWIIPSSKSHYDTKAAYLKTLYLKRLENQRMFQQQASIAQTLRSIETASNSLTIIELSLTTLSNILKALKANISIGNANSLSYANNYTQYISAKLNQIDLHAQILKAQKELELIQKVANRKK